MTVLASIQARLGSTRLPGKVLKPIAGHPMLYWQINRILKSSYIDKLVVATSVNYIDDKIADFCLSNGIECYRGSEEDVLSRIAGLLNQHHFDYHAEFCGDSPLISREIIDSIAGKFLENPGIYDCVCNSLDTTYPPGQEVIIYKASLLVEADRRVAKDDPLREHSGIHVTRDKDLNVLNLQAPPEFHYPDLYMEVDTENDFFVVTKIIEHFLKESKPEFDLADIISFFKHNPDLAAHNQGEVRHWKSFRE